MNAERRGGRDYRQGDARADATDLIFKNVLDNVPSGVVSLDAQGVIKSFNAVASEIVGLAPEAVVGRTFAEVFAEFEGADEFADLIFDAVYDTSVGHQGVVEATFFGRTRPLSVATSYLKEERDGDTVRIGVVAVFSDISEIRELREKELLLARELEAKHAELRDAYRSLEERNRELGATSRRRNLLRLGASAAVLLLFAGVGLYLWNDGSETADIAVAAGSAQADQGSFATLVVEPRPVSSTINIVGRLAPRRQVEVTSPIEAAVAEVHFRYGQRVERGQRLVDLDVAGIRIEHREAQVGLIKARERVDELEDWSNHVEVSRARRVVSRSRTELEAQKNKRAQSAFLLERGLIPASRHEADKRDYRNRVLDLQAAEEDLRVVLEKGAAELRVARLELENARSRSRELEDVMRNASVHAPLAGVIMDPERADADARTGERGKRLTRGVSVRQGQYLVSIGDIDGLTVVGMVDEVDVATIRPGHAARIVGEAFPGIELRGEIARVSSQARKGDSGRKLPSFRVEAVVETLTPGQRGRLRLGMSATLRVAVYEKADALLVPIEAVEFEGDRPRLRVQDRALGTIRYANVVTGVTTVDAVEIVEGIEAGDRIVIPER